MFKHWHHVEAVDAKTTTAVPFTFEGREYWLRPNDDGSFFVVELSVVSNKRRNECVVYHLDINGVRSSERRNYKLAVASVIYGFGKRLETFFGTDLDILEEKVESFVSLCTVRPDFLKKISNPRKGTRKHAPH